MKTLIIIPAYNEAENIERTVTSLRQECPELDYIVINDGSRDNTALICREKGYSLIDLPVNLGLAGAFQTGLRYAYEQGYDAAIQFDGDGQHDPAYIDFLLEEMIHSDSDSDIVIGSRFKEQKKPHSLRMFGNRLLQWIIRLTTRRKLTDPTSGMRVFNRRMMERFAKNINYGPEPDTVAYLIRCGAKISEVQVEIRERIAGTSYLNLGRSMLYMLHMCLSIVFIQFFRKKEA